MWTQTDIAFLRSMRITAEDPPVPLPRFRVEPTDVAGWYRVIDLITPRKPRTTYEAGPPFSHDPRADAEAKARKLNAKHETKSK